MRSFALAPFDASAARIASQISGRYYDSAIRSLKGEGKRQALAAGCRQQLKVDMQILAIAIAQKTDAIYTLDVGTLTHWADGMIPAFGPARFQIVASG